MPCLRMGRALATAPLLLSLLLVPGASLGSVVDTPSFNVLGMVIVWGSDGAGGAQADDFVLMLGSGTSGADLIATDVAPVVTGTLTPIASTIDPSLAAPASFVAPSGGAQTGDGTLDGYLDAGDTFDAFAVDATSDINIGLVHDSSFFVASNTAFNINATAVLPTPGSGAFAAADLDSVTLTLGMTQNGTNGGALSFGGSSQDPGSAPANFIAPTALSGLTNTTVYTGAAATAGTPGSIAAQSVRFDASYQFAPAYDLSLGTGTIQYEVTYTIFVP